MFKREKGITLVALVVTIVVLLILAGVSISLVIGQNGIVTKASDAQKSQDKAYAREQVESALKAVQIEYLANQKTEPGENADKLSAVTDAMADPKFTPGDSTTLTAATILYKTDESTIYTVTVDISDKVTTYIVTGVN